MMRITAIITGILSVIASNAFALPDEGSKIHGRLTDASGNPLAGAAVTIGNTFLGVHSSRNGDYSFSGLKDGIYTLHFSFIGFKTQVHEINLKGDTVLDVSLEEQPYSMGEVIVSGVRAGSNSPMAYTLIDSTFISKHNSGQDIPFILSLTPSLVETSDAGNGIGYTNLRIRGTDASRINITIDGIPVNDAESQQVFWVDLPDIASSIDNIQVQRGVGTSTNGSGAFGGTVSLQTKNPDNKPFAEVSSSLGSFNTFKKMVSAGTGLLEDKLAFQLRYSELKSDGYIDRTGSDHKSAFFGGIYRTAKSLLKTNIILGEEHSGIGWEGVPAEKLSTDRRYNPAGEYTDSNGIIHYYGNETDNYFQDHFQLIYSRKLNDYLSLSSALHYTKGKGYYEEYKDDKAVSDYGLTGISIGDTVITEMDLITRKWLSNDFYGFIFSLKYRKNKLEITSGGGANYYRGEHFGRIIWMQYAGNNGTDHEWYFNSGTKSEINLFGKADYFLNSKISFFGDLQYRYILYRMKGIDNDLKNLDQVHVFNFFNPKAGIFYSLNSDQDLYLSLSVAHREPTRTDFKEASGDRDATPGPETLCDTEMGYKLRGKKLSAGINLYAMYYKDQLVPTGQMSNVGYPISTNVPESYRLGIEFTAGIKPADFLSWDANLTLSRNKITDLVEYYNDYDPLTRVTSYKSKNLGLVDISYSPSVTGSSDLSFRVFKNTGVHLISKFVGRQYFDNTMSRDRMLDPYFINNIRIDYNPAIKKLKDSEFQLLINNILNASYESHAYGGNYYEGGVENSWSYYFPQAGINFMIRATVTF
jgi:iron complex outermembrane receptor protein